jgi:Trk K+ transport system NAD-binding subunit
VTFTTPSKIAYQPRRRRFLRIIRAFLRNARTLLREFQQPVLTFLFVTLVGGYVYGELHAFSGRSALALIDRPYIMLQLMILESPYDAPSEWYLIIFWYLLPVIFVFIVGNGVSDFVRLFFDRSSRNEAWRNALISTYRHHVIVFGAGHVGLRVIRLLHELAIDVVVIDNSPDDVAQAFLEDRQIPLVRADGRNSATLQKAGLRYADAFVACTGDDHSNLDAIMRARSMNSTVRIVIRVWDDQFATQIQDFMHVQHVLSSSNLAAPVFAGLALGAEISQTLHVAGEEYSTIRVTVNEASFLEGKTIGELQRDYDMDIVLYCNGDDDVDVQPSHEVVARAGDTLVIFARHQRSLEIAARNRYQK